MGRANDDVAAEERITDQLERWFRGDEPRTLGSLVEAFGPKSFAIAFVLLLALPALPIPTGGATHVLEVVAMLLALELIAGRREIWLPQRWRRLELEGARRQKLVATLLKRIRQVERLSRPRGQWVLGRRASEVAFGVVVLVLTLTAFLAPPFSGLDTLPSLGVVLLSLGFLLADLALALAGLLVGTLGVVAVVGLGKLVVDGMRDLL